MAALVGTTARVVTRCEAVVVLAVVVVVMAMDAAAVTTAAAAARDVRSTWVCLHSGGTFILHACHTQLGVESTEEHQQQPALSRRLQLHP